MGAGQTGSRSRWHDTEDSSEAREELRRRRADYKFDPRNVMWAYKRYNAYTAGRSEDNTKPRILTLLLPHSLTYRNRTDYLDMFVKRSSSVVQYSPWLVYLLLSILERTTHMDVIFVTFVSLTIRFDNPQTDERHRFEEYSFTYYEYRKLLLVFFIKKSNFNQTMFHFN